MAARKNLSQSSKHNYHYKVLFTQTLRKIYAANVYVVLVDIVNTTTVGGATSTYS